MATDFLGDPSEAVFVARVFAGGLDVGGAGAGVVDKHGSRGVVAARFSEPFVGPLVAGLILVVFTLELEALIALVSVFLAEDDVLDAGAIKLLVERRWDVSVDVTAVLRAARRSERRRVPRLAEQPLRARRLRSISRVVKLDRSGDLKAALDSGPWVTSGVNARSHRSSPTFSVRVM